MATMPGTAANTGTNKGINGIQTGKSGMKK